MHGPYKKLMYFLTLNLTSIGHNFVISLPNFKVESILFMGSSLDWFYMKIQINSKNQYFRQILHATPLLNFKKIFNLLKLLFML